jgi:hypothetical protein
MEVVPNRNLLTNPTILAELYTQEAEQINALKGPGRASEEDQVVEEFE